MGRVRCTGRQANGQSPEKGKGRRKSDASNETPAGASGCGRTASRDVRRRRRHRRRAPVPGWASSFGICHLRPVRTHPRRGRGASLSSSAARFARFVAGAAAARVTRASACRPSRTTVTLSLRCAAAGAFGEERCRGQLGGSPAGGGRCAAVADASGTAAVDAAAAVAAPADAAAAATANSAAGDAPHGSGLRGWVGGGNCRCGGRAARMGAAGRGTSRGGREPVSHTRETKRRSSPIPCVGPLVVGEGGGVRLPKSRRVDTGGRVARADK